MEERHQCLVRLDADELAGIDAQPGRCLVVFEGTVRVTQQGGARDRVVNPGASLMFHRPGLVLVEAIEPASIAVLGTAAAPSETIGYESAWPGVAAAPLPLAQESLHADTRRERAQPVF